MRIVLYRPDNEAPAWMADFSRLLPEAEIEQWREGASDKLRPCDYAVVWAPPAAMLRELAEVKAVFNTGAGVDALLKFGDSLPAHVPIVRLGDGGMGVQMAEYVLHAVLRYFRRFDEYEAQARKGDWTPLAPHLKDDFTIGVLGMGVLGGRVLEALA